MEPDATEMFDALVDCMGEAEMGRMQIDGLNRLAQAVSADDSQSIHIFQPGANQFIQSTGFVQPVQDTAAIMPVPMHVDMSGRVRVHCPQCGSVRTVNLGGAKRGQKYTYLCEQCQFKWSQNRLPDAFGNMDIKVSHRAVGDEPKRSFGYACGKCGAKPKKNHVCTGSRPLSAPTTPYPMSPWAQMGHLQLQQLQAVERARHAAPQNDAPVLAHVVADATVADATLSDLDSRITAQQLHTDLERRQTPPPASMPEASVPEPATEATEATDTANEPPTDTMQATFEATAEQSSEAAGGPTNNTSEAATGEVADDPAAKPADSPARSEAASSSLAPVTSDPIFGRITELSAACSLHEKDFITNEQVASLVEHITSGADVYAFLSFTKRNVKGDGSCWMYAVLDTLRLCDHASSSTTNAPTMSDRARDKHCRGMAKMWLQNNKVNLNLGAADMREIDALDKTPSYPLRNSAAYGSFGGVVAIIGLAAYLKTSIVMWNVDDIQIENCKHTVVLYSPDSDSVEEKQLLAREIAALCLWKPNAVAHVEWNGRDHYASLIGKTPVVLDRTTRTYLERIMPAMKRKNTVSDGCWQIMYDLYRDGERGASARKIIHAPETYANEKQMKQTCLDLGCNAILLIDGSVQFRLYDYAFDESDCQQAGNFSCIFMVHDSVRSKRAKCPDSMLCFCNNIFSAGVNEVTCALCHRWCHAHCVGAGHMRTEELHAAVIVCPLCKK